MSTVSCWYLIYTKPKQERVARIHLKRQGYAVYLPFITVLRRRQGQYQSIHEPMFPRYLFIQLSATTDNWGPIRSTRGVTTIVRFGAEPAKVPVDLIEYLQHHESQAAAPQPSQPVFRPGDSVRVLEGVLAGYEGMYQAKTGTKRVTLLLDIVGKTMKVELPIRLVGHLT